MIIKPKRIQDNAPRPSEAGEVNTEEAVGFYDYEIADYQFWVENCMPDSSFLDLPTFVALLYRNQEEISDSDLAYLMNKYNII